MIYSTISWPIDQGCSVHTYSYVPAFAIVTAPEVPGLDRSSMIGHAP
jgi:hypothetical protein